MRLPGLLPDTQCSLLVDVYRTLPEEDRAEFKQTAEDFETGLNATIEGAARAMRRWVQYPPSWITARRQQQRQRFLAALDRFVEQRLEDAA